MDDPISDDQSDAESPDKLTWKRSKWDEAIETTES